jgi:hypothetical protein
VEDPSERLRLALTALYAWFRETEQMAANVRRDAALVPALGELLADTQAPADAALRELLARGFRARGRARKRLHAALRLATDLWSWHSLARRGDLSDEEAAEVAARALEAALD